MKLQDLQSAICPGHTFHLHRVIVLGPYPTDDFFAELQKLAPSRVSLIVDDGWPEERIKAIEKVFESKHKKCVFEHVRVAPMNSNGLVHAKVYLFEWVNSGKSQTRRVLVLGSANASTLGFGELGSSHAEALAAIRLSSAPLSTAVLEYLEGLLHGASVEECQFSTSTGDPIWLPPIKAVNSKISSFDAWLRRGRLCHKFERDPSFAKLRLNLKKPLPGDEVARLLASLRFGTESETRVLLRPYESYSDKSGAKPKWRGKYFVETNYGHWTSAECFRHRGDEFVSVGSSERRDVLERIRTAAPNQKQLWISQFLAATRKAAENMSSESLKVSNYLHTKTGSIDESWYRKQALKKLKTDRAKASDTTFAERFISGYTFPKVPQMGNEFEEFAISLCESLIAKAMTPYSPSKLGQSLRRAINGSVSFESGRDLLKFVREHWHHLEKHVTAFHQE